MLKRLLFAVLLLASFAAQAVVYSLPWGPKPQFVDANGAPMSGGTIETYRAGSSTPQVTYTDQGGGTSNPTTITLNVRGETPNEVWLTGGAAYKFILKDASGATVWTVDNVSGVNDVTAQLGQEWIASGLTPTFVSATSFTLTGDQTTTLHKGRRLKTVNSGGTVYSTITNSVFGAVTTVTVANDASTLDSGLSSVSYGVISAANSSIGPDFANRKGAAVTSAATTDIWSIYGDYVHISGAGGPITSLGTAPYAGATRTVIFDSTPTLTHNATSLIIPGAANITAAAGDRMIVRADTTANMNVIAYTKASGVAIVVAASSLPMKFISGCTYANNVTDPTNDLDIAACVVRDATNAADITVAALTKQSDVNWAVGTNAGGLDTGAVGNNDYYIWAIKRSDTGVTDFLYSLSSTAPTMPANYDFKRLIGWFKRVGGTIVAFHTYEESGGGLNLTWDVPTMDVALAATLTTARRTDAVKVPLNLSVVADLHVAANDATNQPIWVTNPDVTDAAPTILTTAPLANIFMSGGQSWFWIRVRTSSAGLVASRSGTNSIDTYNIVTMGFSWARKN